MPIETPGFFSGDLRDLEVLNVRDFGAAGDGVTDDWQAISRALTMASGRGGIVHIPGGTFLVSQSVEIPVGVCIRGVGSKRSILRYTGNGVAVSATLGGEFTGDQWISGLSVVGTASGTVGIRIGDTWGFGLQNISVREFTSGIGIQFYNDTNWTEGTFGTNIRVQECSVGVSFTRSASSVYDSFGYTRLLGLAVNVPASGVGIRFGDSLLADGHYVYNSEIHGNFWLASSASAIAFDGDSEGEYNRLFITGEKESGASSTRTFAATAPTYWRFDGAINVASDNTAFPSNVINNVVHAPNAAEAAVQFRGVSGQTAGVLEIAQSDGTVTSRMYEYGAVAAPYLIVGSDESGAFISRGAGSPEGVVSGVPGALFLRTDGGATTTLYVKTSGSGNTGWTAK